MKGQERNSTGEKALKGRFLVYLISVALFCIFSLYSCEKTTTYVKTDDDPLIVKDLTPPLISTVAPTNSAVSVPTGTNLTVTFNEKINATSITTSTFTLKQGSTSVPGTLTSTGLVAVFTPTAALSANKEYTGTITTGVKDSTGNALASEFTWSFTTAADPDTQKPTVVTVAPANNATAVSTNTKLNITFSETMNASTITSATVTLKKGSTAVTGTVTYAGSIATFTPAAVLDASTVYTGTVTMGVKDAAGNALAANYTWSFTTAVPAAGKSFLSDVVPILNWCNDCHNHNWTTSSNTSTFYTNLVNSSYVKPVTPTTSKIYTKINSGHPSSISAAQKNTILTWMTEGSLNN